MQITDDYTIGARIGSGAFAQVFEIEDKKTGEKHALKRIERDFLRYSDLV